MNAVVIGGHTRNIGKTKVMSALISQYSKCGWSAVKITKYGHGDSSHDGKPCGCAPKEHPFALHEETDARGRADTCRYLAAGARRSLWLRAREGQLREALPLLKRRLRGEGWVILESNSILEFIEPLLYLAVVDSSKTDFKRSAREAWVRADALIAVDSRETEVTAARAAGVDRGAAERTPVYPVGRPAYWSSELARFVRQRLHSAATEGAASSETEEPWRP